MTLIWKSGNIYKRKIKLKKYIRGLRTVIRHLFKTMNDVNYVHYSRRIDDSDIVRDIFRTHPDFIKLLIFFSYYVGYGQHVHDKHI